MPRLSKVIRSRASLKVETSKSDAQGNPSHPPGCALPGRPRGTPLQAPCRGALHGRPLLHRVLPLRTPLKPPPHLPVKHTFAEEECTLRFRGVLGVVGHKHQRRLCFGAEAEQELDHRFTRMLVEIPCWFVRQQKPR